MVAQASDQPSCSYLLGIESSCDDTAVAVLRANDGAILGHSIANQACDVSLQTSDNN